MARTRSKVPHVIDFETKGIERRPDYPPKPVGVSITYPGKKAQYFSYGERYDSSDKLPKNVVICDKVQVDDRLKDIERSGAEMLFHHAKFDVDVAMVHHGMQMPRWDRIHDTMYLIFLDDPHQKSLSLKPSAERILGMEPEERDAVKDWILAHKGQIEKKIGHTFKPSEWGAYICEAPPSITGPYANGDTDRTLGLFQELYPRIIEAGMEGAYDRERELMPILLENERQGVRIDVPRLMRDIKIFQDNMVKTETWLRKRLKTPDLEFDKDGPVADALERAKIVTEWVLTPTGKRSVAKKNMTPDMFKDRRVAQALGYRNRLKTALDTFMVPWSLMAARTGGLLHPGWNQVRTTDHGSAGARTGRMSCSPNLMNIPTDWYDKNDGYVHPAFLGIDELPLVRRYIIGDKGHDFGGRDYNQQELRILAHYEDDVLMAEYNANPFLDVHKYVQDAITRIIGREIPRKAIKILNFGTIYGMGLGKLAAGMDVDVETAQQVNNARRAAMPGVKALEKQIKDGARDDIPIRTWGGRLYYKEPSMVINGRTVDFGYKLLNYLIQGSAADCTKQSIINYHAIKKEGRFLASVHDENNISAPRKAMKAELKILGEAMRAVEFDVPMVSEPYFGPNWAEVEKYKEKV